MVVNLLGVEKTVRAPWWTSGRRVSRGRYLAALSGTCLGGLKVRMTMCGVG